MDKYRMQCKLSNGKTFLRVIEASSKEEAEEQVRGGYYPSLKCQVINAVKID